MTISPCSFAEIMQSPNFPALMEEYAAECSIPEIGPINPQPQIYAALEHSGALQCFAVLDDGLIGFLTILTTTLPHYGKKTATVESVFVTKSKRKGGTGRKLINIAKEYAKEQGCAVLFFSAPAGGVLEKVLHFIGFKRTNTVFGWFPC